MNQIIPPNIVKIEKVKFWYVLSTYSVRCDILPKNMQVLFCYIVDYYTVLEIKTSLDLRHSITFQSLNSLDFRYCLKSELKIIFPCNCLVRRCLKFRLFVRISDTSLEWLKSGHFCEGLIKTPFFSSANPTQNFLKFRQVLISDIPIPDIYCIFFIDCAEIQTRRPPVLSWMQAEIN